MRTWRRSRVEAATSAPPTEQERQITEGLADLRSRTARELMTPRPEVVALEAPVTIGMIADAMSRSGRSHYPVYEGDLDHLLGVLFVKDLFVLFRSGTIDASLDVTSRARAPYLVPESRDALEVLADMRRSRRGFALVVDEHGGVSGVLTINDIVSELVGDLRDEYDRSPTPTVRRSGPGRFTIEGSATVDEVSDATGVEIPDGDYVTIGGFLLAQLGRIPDAGDVLERDGSRFTITTMDRRRIASVVLETPSATISE
jgi:putative hemolysin